MGRGGQLRQEQVVKDSMMREMREGRAEDAMRGGR
jgi:hypothetical protein